VPQSYLKKFRKIEKEKLASLPNVLKSLDWFIVKTGMFFGYLFCEKSLNSFFNFFIFILFYFYFLYFPEQLNP
jgi:hypothetical protein